MHQKLWDRLDARRRYPTDNSAARTDHSTRKNQNEANPPRLVAYLVE